MKTELILVGKTVNKHFIAGIKDYAERITHYMPFNITTIPELKNTKSLSEQQQKEREGELILKLLQPSDTVVLMDEHGQEFRSIEFAKWIERKQATARRLVFVRRSLRFLTVCLRPRQREDFPLQDDLLASDGAPYLYRGALSRMYYYKR